MTGERRRALLACLLALACGSKQRDLAMARLTSPSAKTRQEAVRALVQSGAKDDEAWAALAKAARDGSAAVRAEAAGALAATKRADAPDAISPLLRDPDDLVRLAAARALTGVCGDRTTAYLRMAFSRSDAQVRAQVADSLKQCGVDPAQTLQREESERRRKAQEQLASPFAAQRAHAAHELGLLGREEDRKALAGLLGERDGVVVAAAARGLGESRAQEAAPLLAALLNDGGEVAAAAAEALLALGPQAIAPARPKLIALSRADSDEAVAAAAALAADPLAPKQEVCAAALAAQAPQAAALLSAGCPAAPFARALASAKARDPLLEALLRAEGPGPGLDATLSKLLRAGDTDARLPLIARRYHAAGPGLVDALRREQKARAAELGAQERRADDSGESAAEIARAPSAGLPDKERYGRLMTLLRERAGAESDKASAASRLDALLHGDDGSSRRAFIVGALRAALDLKAPGADKLASGFTKDPDPAIAAAARGEPEPAPRKAAPKPFDPRLSLWSDDGAVRARACAAPDPALAGTRTLLAASDPERRVRDACASTNETAARK